MGNDIIKKIMAEKRRVTIGQLSDLLISGELRRELLMSKEEFSGLVGVQRALIRRVEGFEVTPNMRLILNTAAVFRFGINFPDCGNYEIVPRRKIESNVS